MVYTGFVWIILPALAAGVLVAATHVPMGIQVLAREPSAQQQLHWRRRSELCE